MELTLSRKKYRKGAMKTVLKFALLILYCYQSSVCAFKDQIRTQRSWNNSKYIIYDHEIDENVTTVIGAPEERKEPDLTSANKSRTSHAIAFLNASNETTTELDYYAILSQEFLNCTHVNLEREFFQELQNGSVYVPMYNMVFSKADHLVKDNLLFICPVFYKEFEDNEKFSSNFSLVSNICMGISATCIVLHIVMFCLVRRLRNLPGYILLSLCIALLSAYLCTVIQYEFYEYLDCTTIGMFLLYFFLASFFWMNTMSYDVWRSIRMATAKLRLTADRPIMIRFGRYSLYSWGVPLMIIIASIIVHNTASEDSKYRLVFNMENCWFKYKQALLMYFAIPLFTLLGLNVVFFISSFYMISMATMSKSQSGAQNGSDLWSRLFLSLRLGSVMGFMWIFGIIATVTNKLGLWYLYAACNALQGVFIFFSFTISERTRKACKKALKGRKFSTMPTQTSTNTNSQVSTHQTTAM